MNYNRSESLKELAPALAKVMSEVGPALKDSTNPHFRSKYANLAACHAVSIGPLTANGFSFPMFPSYDLAANTLSVTALLLHSSGEFIESTLTIPLKDGANAQDVLAAETYARRGLYPMVGVVPDDDDDGETAVGRGQSAPQRQEQRREPPAPKPRQEAAKPASQPPPRQLQDELKDRGILKGPQLADKAFGGTQPPQPEDEASDPLAKDDELMNTLLGEAFQRLTAAGMNGQQKIIFARDATGSHPNGWRVSDGKKFLTVMAEKYPQ